MTDGVQAVPETRTLLGRDWKLQAEWVHAADGGEWSALIGISRGLKLLARADGPAESLTVEAWAGEPGQSDGVAVVDTGGGEIRAARVPLCQCGVRECGNAGIQLAKQLPADELPALIDLLRELDWTDATPTGANVLRGTGLAGIGERDTDSPGADRWYAYAPRTGTTRRP